MRNTFIGIVVFLFFLIVVVFWYQGGMSGQSGVSDAGIGSANPAAVHCTDIGGRIEILQDTADTQIGICHLRDGRACEEWALFRDGTCVSAD